MTTPPSAGKPRTIEVEMDEWLRIQERLDKLDALEACGVDNWDGYSDAMEMLDDEYED